ncbi:probable transmembrane GTPase FZO-like, chloroplastic [Primulina huaijiensis]|uniref:probable transmembrane GTPase FZO-like, chloroplastic n=1 Tax=Primulina huaijiensis TaxID=1492673 RepID=UPI003CC7630C
MVISSVSPFVFSMHLAPHLFFSHPKLLICHRPTVASTSAYFYAHCVVSCGRRPVISNSAEQNPPRTLFPGGYKRPEIKVPNLVLRLSSDEVFRDNKLVLDVIDDAVVDRVGIVVLTGGRGSGKMLYEAACLLKSVIRERAYLLIDERVDIAAAVNASGVLLSDEGLPTIVARNTMMDAKNESVVMPLVGRNVQTHDAASDASNFEGADFLILTVDSGRSPEQLVSSVYGRVKIPIFVTVDSFGYGTSFTKASDLLRSGASGVVVSVDELSLFKVDELNKHFFREYASRKNVKLETSSQSFDEHKTLDVENGLPGRKTVTGFKVSGEREQQLIEKERSFLLEAVDAIQRAAPLMGEISLLRDAVSQLDEPFLLVIVGEFNSGKSSVINAFLGQRYLKDGVVPTTNELTFLRYSESDSGEERCERHPDGQLLCYLSAPILKDMIIVDTPGTNVILQRQQRLTEEFVPRSDLLLFVMSSDRPLTESEVTFLRYIQQWKKKIVFVLNKSDLYQNADELEEAVAFIKENAKKMLNSEHISLFPVSARSVLEAKLAVSSGGLDQQEKSVMTTFQGACNFSELEKYLNQLLDSSTGAGIERMKLKLETPVQIAEQLLTACQKLVREECQQAKLDLVSVNDLLKSVKEYASKLESESLTWKRQILSMIDTTQARAIKLAESTLRLSNLDVAISYVFKGHKSSQMPATSRLRNDIIDPAVSEVQKLLEEYVTWLQSSKAGKGKFYKESFEKRWPLLNVPSIHSQLEASELLSTKHELGRRVMEDFSGAAASKLLEQEMREVFVGTVGGLGVAGLSASLLTSVLSTTLEDLLALGLCSAGGLLAISNFPASRQRVIDKVKRTANALARQIDEAMQNDLLETTNSLNNFVTLIGKPYQEVAEDRVSKLSDTLDELTAIEEKLKTLQIEIQNLHVSR